MYDIIVIGGGPAGLSAAITARVRNKKVLVISNRLSQNPLAKTKVVNNYPGIPQVSGLQLLKQMLSHARGLGADFVFERVVSILPTEGRFAVATGSMNSEGQSIILATGTQHAKAFEGEKEFLGRGVSYCATCDGMLYRTQSVCVVGLGADAVDEANFLGEIGATVLFLGKKPPVGLDSGILFKNGEVVRIRGDEMGVTGLEFKERATGSIETAPCSGVFVLRPSIAPDALMDGLTIADSGIVVDDTMCAGVEGVFAAGDCLGQPFQVSKAAGEGQRACFGAVRYLDQR
ncbi:MAG: FAD-dependent oxidoreductase [Coriobacteriales bacterium]|jgi:thioredoxin reductase (NADPH)|nr:FAD-dependent oxidoreductase [Coriobacteriales bacterium]